MRLIDCNSHPPYNSNILTTSEIDPDDLSNSLQLSFNYLDNNYIDKDQADNAYPQPFIIIKRSLSDKSSSINDSDQELMEDYSYQIDCLKEEMLTEFPDILPGIVPLYDTSRHNSCAAISFPQFHDLSEDFVSYNIEINEQIEVINFATDFIKSVIEFAKNIIEEENKEDNVLNESYYYKLISNISEDLVNTVIQESMKKIINDNFNSFGPDGDLSPVLEPDSPLTEDGDCFEIYNETQIIQMEFSQNVDLINKGTENNLGMIIPGSGDDCNLVPLSPIMECLESDKSQELLSDKRSISDNIVSCGKEMYVDGDKMEEYQSSSSKEYEDFECDKNDHQTTTVTLLCKSPSTDYFNHLMETAIIDDGGDLSETQSFNSTPSSQQCSVICTSRRAESLQQIDSESAAGLAIDLLSSESRTTSMSSSIMQTSFHSTDSATLTATTTASTLVKVTQPYDDLNSLSDQISPGCLSSG